MPGTRIPDNSPDKSGVTGRFDPALSPRRHADSRVEGNVPSGAGDPRRLKTAAGYFPSGGPLSQGAANQNAGSVPAEARSSIFTQPKLPLEGAGIPRPENIPVRDPAMQAAASLGLPKDALSAALISFASFFSLSLKPDLLIPLRREILASGKNSSPADAEEKAALEAETFALVSSADKGLVLRPETLARYAAFFAPPKKGETAKEGDTPAEGDSSPRAGEAEDAPPREPKPRPGGEEKTEDALPAPGKLRAMAEEEARAEAFLDFLNSAPGKNAQHWIVLPLNLSVKGIELKIFIRILKGDTIFSPAHERMIVDVSAPKREWRVSLKKAGEKFRADIQVYPEYSRKALNSLRKEAERFFGEENVFTGEAIHFESILVRNRGRQASWTEAPEDMYLPSIDENV